LTMLLIIFLLCRYLDKQSRYSQVLIGEIVILIFFSGLFFIMFFLRHQPLNLWSFLISYLTSALLLAGIWVISGKFN
jgi:phosphoglycerol transferase MdoB-like AlkP superfamily enzyme